MNESALMRALAKRFVEDEDGKPAKPQCPEASAHDLLVRYRKLQEKHEFKPGDLVRVKPGVGGYRDGEDPHVVITTNKEDVVKLHGKRDPQRLGEQIEVQDMVVGAVDRERDRIVLHAVESRRFEPWPYPVED